MTSAKAVLGILLVFILGGAVGVTATHMFYHPRMEKLIKGDPEMREEMLVKRLDHKLDLDNKQLEQVKVIVHETHQEIRQIKKESRPRIEAALEKSQARVNTLLRPDQQAKFARLIAERKERHQKD